jgi:hypothetical protein
MQEFNMETFNAWVQDNCDYSMISTKEGYIARKTNDAITYCTKVLNLMPLDAWIVANNVHIKESKRLLT